MPTTRDDSRLHDMMHYPVGHVVGILWDGQEAKQAAQSLHEAGYTDVVVLDGPPALKAFEIDEYTANPIARAWEQLKAYLDDPDGREEALSALAQGHAIVMVHASGNAQQEQAESILRAHGAHAVRYFGRWSITEVNR